MDDLLEALARLEARLEGLEHRVSALERPAPAGPRRVPSSTASAASPIASEAIPFMPAGGTFPVIGKALLGIAGAYVLRAIAESGSFPKLAVVVIALAYTATWLVWAARASSGFASTAYAATAGLILAPMIWELTLRFQFLPTPVTAGILAAFQVLASALAWKRKLAPVIWAGNVAAVVAALALLIATHDLAPFTSALLVMSLGIELAACRKQWLGVRPLTATASDLAVWILIYIYTRAAGARHDYTDLSPATLVALPSALFLIFGASITFRAAVLRERMTIFEICQAVIAFVLAFSAVLQFGPQASGTILGMICLLLAAGCYALAFSRFDGLPEARNYQTYAAWAAALVLAGSFLCLGPVALVLFLSAGAIIATVAGVRAARLALEFHGLLYVGAAAFASGLLDYAGRALAGTFPKVPGWTVWIVAASAVLCYAIGERRRGERWRERVLRLMSGTLAVGALATVLVSALVWLVALGMVPAASHVAMIRTLITCALALALAYAGSHWQRAELVWIAYGTLAFVTAKLLFDDLQNGQPGSIAVSIFLYAVALILVPRMTRLGRPIPTQLGKSASL